MHANVDFACTRTDILNKLFILPHYVLSHYSYIYFFSHKFHFQGVKDVDAFNVAFCEMGGHIPVKSK